MEERTVVVKPVACRPTCSGLRSLSQLLAGSPSNASPPAAVAATGPQIIRPKIVKIKPAVKCVPFKDKLLGTTDHCSADKDLKMECESTVVYKPLAKLVSKATMSLLADLEISYVNHQPAEISPCIPPPNQVHQHLRSDISLNGGWKNPSGSETEKASEPPSKAADNLEENKRPSASSIYRASYDGYNWRKYGQKQVKGSECPRSYYKCTHPNCLVKKMVERTLDGQVTEIVYKGEHSHIKPQHPKRNISGGEGHVLMSNAIERNEGSEGRLEGLTNSGKCPLFYDPMTTGTVSRSSDNLNGLSVDADENREGVEEEDSEPKTKRRKNEIQSSEADVSEDDLEDHSVVIRSKTDTELTADGFRWRKYGQKVVKGSPYPRSYYRCTSLKCNARKHVERVSDDPKALITTYEGKHNHDIPIKTKNMMPSGPDAKAMVS